MAVIYSYEQGTVIRAVEKDPRETISSKSGKDMLDLKWDPYVYDLDQKKYIDPQTITIDDIDYYGISNKVVGKTAYLKFQNKVLDDDYLFDLYINNCGYSSEETSLKLSFYGYTQTEEGDEKLPYAPGLPIDTIPYKGPYFILEEGKEPVSKETGDDGIINFSTGQSILIKNLQMDARATLEVQNLPTGKVSEYVINPYIYGSTNFVAGMMAEA